MRESETTIRTIDYPDLTDLLAPYSNKWVALSPDESQVIAVGLTPLEAIHNALNLGVINPVLTHVPKNHISHVI